MKRVHGEFWSHSVRKCERTSSKQPGNDDEGMTMNQPTPKQPRGSSAGPGYGPHAKHTGISGTTIAWDLSFPILGNFRRI